VDRVAASAHVRQDGRACACRSCQPSHARVSTRAQPSARDDGACGSILVPTGLPTGRQPGPVPGERPPWLPEVGTRRPPRLASPEGFDGDELHAAYAELVTSRSPRLVVHVPPQYSFPTHGHHLKAAREFQRLCESECGEAPEMWVAVQHNGKGKPGDHSHWLGCGTEALLEVRRRRLWELLRSTMSTYPGIGQPGHHEWRPAPGAAHRDRSRSTCGTCGEQHEERVWVGDVPNSVRLRIEPVQVHGDTRNTASIAYYVVRYVTREDVETAFYTLPGGGVQWSGGVPW
jgi:hypothetical protein